MRKANIFEPMPEGDMARPITRDEERRLRALDFVCYLMMLEYEEITGKPHDIAMSELIKANPAIYRPRAQMSDIFKSANHGIDASTFHDGAVRALGLVMEELSIKIASVKAPSESALPASAKRAENRYIRILDSAIRDGAIKITAGRKRSYKVSLDSLPRTIFWFYDMTRDALSLKRQDTDNRAK